MLKLAPRKKVENLPLYNNVIKCYETEYKCAIISDNKMYFQWTQTRANFFGEAFYLFFFFTENGLMKPRICLSNYSLAP